MLTDFEFNKIIEALAHAERNAHSVNKETWKYLAVRAKQELPALMASTSACRCEDKPACGCDADVYQRGEHTDIGDLADRQRERMEQQRDEDACSICATYFEDTDNEDDVVQGFHAECAESQA